MNQEELDKRIAELEQELRVLRSKRSDMSVSTRTVDVPVEYQAQFLAVEKRISEYFNDLMIDPESGEITAQGQRYIILRTDTISHEFIDFIVDRYSDQTPEEAVSIGNNFLYDNAKVFGKNDASAFHQKLGLSEAIDRLTAGPIHFAFTGWANVDIDEKSSPTPDENYFLKFIHENSFEAQSWLRAGKKSDIPVCTMNAGYSAGWCEESFGIPLTTVEVTCEARGDDKCLFLMAPTSRVQEYVDVESSKLQGEEIEVPVFFKRQKIEQELRESLQQKELLIQEVHHRVKNNLQVISSLLRLQMDNLSDDVFKDEFESTINRVMIMAAVHELMYQKKDFDKVNMRTYIREIAESLIQLYKITDTVSVELSIDIEDQNVDLERSIPLALILNEVICNAFKHGLKDGGSFFFRVSKENERFILEIGDTGPGFDDDEFVGKLGLPLIDILCEQIDAEKKVNNSKNGVIYTISFKIDE